MAKNYSIQTARRIIEQIYVYPGIVMDELSESLKLSRPTVSKYVKYLNAKKMISSKPLRGVKRWNVTEVGEDFIQKFH